MESEGYGREWMEAVNGFLCLSIDRIVDYSSTQCVPDPAPTQSGIRHTFSRFAFGATWDFIEGAVAANYAGSYYGAVEWVSKYAEHASLLPKSAKSHVIRGSAISQEIEERFDLVITDPPYYDAIPYSDLMDFFSTALNTARTGSISAFQLDQQFGSFGFGSGLSHDFAPVHRLALAFGHACRTIR